MYQLTPNVVMVLSYNMIIYSSVLRKLGNSQRKHCGNQGHFAWRDINVTFDILATLYFDNYMLNNMVTQKLISQIKFVFQNYILEKKIIIRRTA